MADGGVRRITEYISTRFFSNSMSTRIPVSWIVLFVVAAAFAFFGYHILQASGNKESNVQPVHVQQPPEIAQAMVQQISSFDWYLVLYV
jgi:hypothetical protein